MLGFGVAVFAKAAEPRPNVLWLIAEDLSPDLGCYGESNVSTPILDGLASGGVRFTRAFTTAPVCSPSRSAFMTGMYQTTIDAQNHRSHRHDGYKLPEGVKTLPDWLRAAGYFTANIRSFPAPISFECFPKTDWNFTPDGKPFDSEEWTDLKTHQPFYAQVNFSETHRVWDEVKAGRRPYPAPHKIDPDTVVAPPYYPNVPEVRADWANYLDDVMELDRKIGEVLAQLERDGLADSTVVIFIGDHGEAHVRGKQWCYDSGLRIPMIVHWPKNFPVPAGFDKGAVEGRLVEAIDLTPTTLAIAGAPVPPKMQGRVIFGDRADPPRKYAFGARDRCDETVFRLRTVRDERFRYIRNFTPERPFLELNRYKENTYPMLPVMRRLHWEGKLDPVQERLFDPTMPAEELYDETVDPYEIHNLVDSANPEDRAALERLRTALNAWIQETDDQGRFFETKEEIAKQEAEMVAFYPHPLVWDAEKKTQTAAHGAKTVEFSYDVKNTGAKPVTVFGIREPDQPAVSARMPAQPWIIAPGATGSLRVEVDVADQTGSIAGSIWADSDSCPQELRFEVDLARR